MCRVFEVMMLQIRDRMAHVVLPTPDLLAPDERSVPLKEPRRLYADLSLAGIAALEAHPEHFEAVSRLRISVFVHRRAVKRTSFVRQSGAADHAMRRIGRMIEGRKQSPFRAHLVDFVVIEKIARERSLYLRLESPSARGHRRSEHVDACPGRLQ